MTNPPTNDELKKAIEDKFEASVRLCAEELLKNPDDSFVVKAISESFQEFLFDYEQHRQMEEERRELQNLLFAAEGDNLNQIVRTIIEQRDAMNIPQDMLGNLKLQLQQVEKERDELIERVKQEEARADGIGNRIAKEKAEADCKRIRLERDQLTVKITQLEKALREIVKARRHVVYGDYVNPMDYLNDQFPHTVGHIPLIRFLGEFELAISNPTTKSVLKDKQQPTTTTNETNETSP